MPTASTIILQRGAAVLGTVIAWLPSLGVLANNVLKVTPLSVDNKIFTLAVLIGAPVVPATSHVIVSVCP
ncbi:hypothetical protein D3C72_903420 [compost metagenome]